MSRGLGDVYKRQDVRFPEHEYLSQVNDRNRIVASFEVRIPVATAVTICTTGMKRRLLTSIPS